MKSAIAPLFAVPDPQLLEKINFDIDNEKMLWRINIANLIQARRKDDDSNFCDFAVRFGPQLTRFSDVYISKLVELVITQIVYSNLSRNKVFEARLVANNSQVRTEDIVPKSFSTAMINSIDRLRQRGIPIKMG